MSRIAWVTCARMQPYSERELPVIRQLELLGHEVHSCVWNESRLDLQSMDWIIIRTPWDYYEHVSEFEKWVKTLPEDRVLNSKKVLLWNIDKVYLRELAEKGIDIVPTIIHQVNTSSNLRDEVSKIPSREVVIKPSQSASSYLTNIVKQGDEIDSRPYLGKRVLIQPKLKEIIEDGECSLIFFGGKFSHAVLKKAKAGDFRVQASFGGSTEAYLPEPHEIDFGTRVVAAIPEPTLYARVDYVKLQGRPHLMELEVLEPDLFFDVNPDSIDAFLNAFQHIEIKGKL